MPTAQRGQVLILWIFGTLTILGLMIGLLWYGQVLSVQLRAQNAADAAAQAALAAQTQPFNELKLVLYAGAVEEWRIHGLIDALTLVTHQVGGCARYPNSQGALDLPTRTSRCADDYASFRAAYLQATRRYSADVGLVSRIVAKATQANLSLDAAAIVASLKANCGTANGGDCLFSYAIPPGGYRTRGHLPNYFIEAPSYGIIPSKTPDSRGGAPNANWAPAEVEVAVCTTVQPIVPHFFGLTLPKQRIVAVAAVSAIAVNSEILVPGSVINPMTGAMFQPDEPWRPSLDFDGNGNDNYTVKYSSAPFSAYPRNNGNAGGYNAAITDFSSPQQLFYFHLNWWNGIGDAPFLPASTISAATTTMCP